MASWRAVLLILVGWVAMSYYEQEHSVAAAAHGVIFILALFACVVLHELGHALTAQRFGIRTRDITLLPIGGIARLERMPEDPRQELLVALAGPAVNVVIAAVLYSLLSLSGTLTGYAQLSFKGENLALNLMAVNVILVLFNLLPAFPMDGGRVLRALLATRMDYVQATQIAAHIGQFMAFVFGFVGLLFNPFLIFIALFVYMGAEQEAAMVQMRTVFRNLKVGEAMLTEFHALSEHDSLQRAVDYLLSGSQQDFPVVDGSQVIGLLPRSELLRGLSQLGMEVPVSSIMRREAEWIDVGDPLEKAFARMQSLGWQALPVISNGSLVGLITLENIGEFLLVRSALRHERAPMGLAR